MTKTMRNNVLLFLFLSLSLTSCLTNFLMENTNTYRLTKDNFSQDLGFTHIGMIRVKVIDKTLSLNKYKVNLILDDNIISTNGNWTTKEDTYKYDGLAMFQTKAAVLPLKHVNIRYSSGNTTSWVNIDINKSFELANNQVNYLGILEISIEGKSDEKLASMNSGETTYDISYATNYAFLFNMETLKSDIEEFSASNPETLKHFDNNIKQCTPFTLILYEEFLDNSKGWFSGSYEIGSYTVKDDYYYLTSKTENKACWSVMNFNSPLEGNSEILLDTYWMEGETNFAYGLLFGKDAENLYKFYVSGNGYTAVSQLIENEEVEIFPVPWTKNTVETIDVDPKKNLRLSIYQNEIHFFVNDKRIATVPSLHNNQNWCVGVYVSGKQSVAFDRFLIKSF